MAQHHSFYSRSASLAGQCGYPVEPENTIDLALGSAAILHKGIMTLACQTASGMSVALLGAKPEQDGDLSSLAHTLGPKIRGSIRMNPFLHSCRPSLTYLTRIEYHRPSNS